MKTLLKFYSIIIFSAILLVSCENKSELTENYISGSIESYDPASFDSICCMDYKIDSLSYRMINFHKVGKCNISTKGNFHAVLNEPVNTYPILSGIDREFIISDTTAIIGYLSLQAYKNGNIVGYVIKCSNDYLINTLGSDYSSRIYTNKDVTIEGTIYFGVFKNSITYHLNLKKGWNEVVYTYKVTSLPGNIIVSLEVTNTTSEDLKWRYIKYN